jgi:subtilisin family serine protease
MILDKKTKERILAAFKKNTEFELLIRASRAQLEAKGLEVTYEFKSKDNPRSIVILKTIKDLQKIEDPQNKEVVPQVPESKYRALSTFNIGKVAKVRFSNFNEVSQNVITLQQSIINIKADRAHELGLKGEDVRVAVVDTGVDHNHQLLEHRIINERSFVEFETPYDENGHGTWCASAVLAVAPEAKIVNAKGLDWVGDGEPLQLMKALDWAVTDESTNCQIISCSWGDGDPFEELHQRIIELENTYGCKFIFAAGNRGPQGGTMSYPGAYPEITSVGATAVINPKKDSIASFSSRGPGPNNLIEPDICAPGGSEFEGILGAWPGDAFKAKKGTSMATPQVAGAIALLMGVERVPQQVIDLLYQTARNPNNNEKDNDYGHGVIDIEAAIRHLNGK